MSKPTYTAIDATDQVIEPGQHLAVRVEHPLLAQPIIITAHRSEKRMTWKEAKAWAESLDINGWKWRLPTVEEAFLIVDRTRAETPALPTEFFPDCEGEWIWTATEDAQPPSGYAWVVYLNDGYSSRGNVGNHDHVRAVRAGQ